MHRVGVRLTIAIIIVTFLLASLFVLSLAKMPIHFSCGFYPHCTPISSPRIHYVLICNTITGASDRNNRKTKLIWETAALKNTQRTLRMWCPSWSPYFSPLSVFVKGHFSPDDNLGCFPETGHELIFLPNERDSPSSRWPLLLFLTCFIFFTQTDPFRNL